MDDRCMSFFADEDVEGEGVVNFRLTHLDRCGCADRQP